MRGFLTLAIGALTCLSGSLQPSRADASCGGETPCDVGIGEYFIKLPDNWNGYEKLGAVVFIHGYRGNGRNEIRNKSFQKMADELGVALIAAQGIKGTWSFPTAPRNLRDEFAYFDAITSDAAEHHGVDRDRILISGFSSGGFMTWYLACQDAGNYAGYAPIAGAFWKPLPEKCPSAAPFLFHVHGTSDKVVPLEGRPLGGGKWHQGDVFKSFDIWRRQTGQTDKAASTYTEGKLSCERWTPEHGVLELCLHEGGHSIRAEWIKRAWRELSLARGWTPG